MPRGRAFGTRCSSIQKTRWSSSEPQCGAVGRGGTGDEERGHAAADSFAGRRTVSVMGDSTPSLCSTRGGAVPVTSHYSLQHLHRYLDNTQHVTTRQTTASAWPPSASQCNGGGARQSSSFSAAASLCRSSSSQYTCGVSRTLAPRKLTHTFLSISPAASLAAVARRSDSSLPTSCRVR